MFIKHRSLFSFLIGSLISFSLFRNGAVEAGKRPCKTCKEFVVSFEQRFKDTEKSNYAGGDTSWEEEKLGSYANSEVRLVEILDGVCRHSDYDCHRILENNEEELEIWWFKLRHKEGKSDLKQWLCFSHLDVCCPNNTFGPNCEECPGGMTNPCGGRGSCEGSEEKDGSGKCSCNRGYEGDICQECSKGFFNDTDEEEKFTCEACDKACKDSCTGAGPDMCDECATGYELIEEEDTCKDIDECKDEDICKEGTYCLNLQGSHKCNTCDKACLKICNGPGPAKCAECAKGYTRDRAGICKDDDECEEPLTCKAGTYCENQPGSFICKACHVSCKLECLGPGAGGCVECREGYNMENETCTDVNECSEESSPCDSETETCQNLMGSYICKCREGLVKSTDGSCIPEEDLPPEVKPKKPKKKKKSKKGGKTKKSSKKKEREGGEKGEDGEPALPDGPATPREQTSESDEVAPDNNLTPPQAAQQTLEGSSEKVDSVNDLTLEGGEKVPADVELEEKADITPSPPAEASVIDNANSSESTNEGADSPTTSTDKDSTESVESTSVVEDQTGSSVDEGNLLAESAADTTVAGNVSAEEIREDVRTGRIDGEPQQVLNDVQAERVSRETSEDSHDEL